MNKRTRAFSKIEILMNYEAIYEFIDHIFINNKYTQTSYRCFCELYVLYTFGDLFIHPAILYKGLSQLHLIVHITNSSTSYVDLDSDNIDDPVEDHVTVIKSKGCTMSPRLVKCLKMWHVQKEFDNIIDTMMHLSERYRYVMNTPMPQRNMGYDNDDLIMDLADYPEVGNLLYKLWKHSHTYLLDLLKCIRPIDVYHIAKSDSLLEIKSFLADLNKNFFNPKFYRSKKRFGVSDVTDMKQ